MTTVFFHEIFETVVTKIKQQQKYFSSRGQRKKKQKPKGIETKKITETTVNC